MRISPSQVQVWMECPQKWDYSYRQGLKPKGHKKVFDKGLYTHELLHTYYHTLELGYEPGSEFAINFMLSRMENDIKTADPENLDVLASILPVVRRYITQVSPQIDKGIEIIQAEKEFRIDYEGITLHGIIDLVYRRNRKIVVRDHKTSEKKNAWRVEHLNMLGQLLLYIVAMELELGERIRVAEINFLNTYPYKQLPPLSDLFKVLPKEYNDHEVKVFLDNLVTIHKRMTEDEPYRAYGETCKGCQFNVLCNLEAKGQSTMVVMTNFTKKEVTE